MHLSDAFVIPVVIIGRGIVDFSSSSVRSDNSIQFIQHAVDPLLIGVQHLVLGGLLVDIGLAVVRLLVDLVSDGITSSLGSGSDGGIAVFGDLLVGLLGCGGTGTLDALGHVVCGVPGGGMLVRCSDGCTRSWHLLDGIHCDGWCFGF